LYARWVARSHNLKTQKTSPLMTTITLIFARIDWVTDQCDQCHLR
jgi:hypothetical protein